MESKLTAMQYMERKDKQAETLGESLKYIINLYGINKMLDTGKLYQFDAKFKLNEDGSFDFCTPGVFEVKRCQFCNSTSPCRCNPGATS